MRISSGTNAKDAHTRSGASNMISLSDEMKIHGFNENGQRINIADVLYRYMLIAGDFKFSPQNCVHSEQKKNRIDCRSALSILK